MIKKIIYGLAGVIGLLIFLAIVVPTPDSDMPIPQANQVPTDKNDEAVLPKADIEIQEPKIPAPAIQPDIVKPATVQFVYYSVTDVVDGDTVKISKDGVTETLRLIGIDTPETVDPRKPVQCFGIESSNRAKELLIGKKVRIESDSTQDTRDIYGRLLVYVYREDGLFFNKRMIEDGYAYEYTYDKPYKYQAEFKAAQLTAKNSGSGLWSPDTCNGQTGTASQPSSGKFYTSSHYSAQYYYPESCDGWKGLSEKYLQSFDTLNALLAKYNRTLSPQCP